MHTNRSTSFWLHQYLSREISLDRLYEWLIDVEWDASAPEDERNLLAQLRLLALDVIEGTTSQFEFDRDVITLLQAITGSTAHGAGGFDLATATRSSWYIHGWDASEVEHVHDLLISSRRAPTPVAVDATALTEVPAQAQRLVVGSQL